VCSIAGMRRPRGPAHAPLVGRREAGCHTQRPAAGAGGADDKRANPERVACGGLDRGRVACV